jgi:hypothetical protein
MSKKVVQAIPKKKIARGYLCAPIQVRDADGDELVVKSPAEVTRQAKTT